MLEICTSLASSSYKIQTLDSISYTGQISLKLSQEMDRIWYSGLSLNTFSAPTMCQPLLCTIPEQTAALTFWSSWSGLGQRGRVMMGQTKLFSTLSICPSIHFSTVRGALLHCFVVVFFFFILNVTMEKYQILRVHLNEFSEGQPATQIQSKDTPAHQSPPVPP